MLNLNKMFVVVSILLAREGTVESNINLHYEHAHVHEKITSKKACFLLGFFFFGKLQSDHSFDLRNYSILLPPCKKNFSKLSMSL